MPSPDDVTCPGYCCAAFSLSRKITDQRKNKHRFIDGEQIADMLIPLTPKQARERYEKASGKTTKAFRWDRRGYHFTCKNWDEDTKLCRIYEDRPAMCRDYPYGKECQHGCGVCGGLPTEERRKIREEECGNQWKAYEAPGGGEGR